MSTTPPLTSSVPVVLTPLHQISTSKKLFRILKYSLYCTLGTVIYDLIVGYPDHGITFGNIFITVVNYFVIVAGFCFIGNDADMSAG